MKRFQPNFRRQDPENLRWSDTQTIEHGLGVQVLSRDLARVNAPYPCVWRIFVSVMTNFAGNLAVPCFCRMSIGVGSSLVVYEAQIPAGLGPLLGFPLELPNDVIPNGALSSFEIPAQTMAVQVRAAASIGAGAWTFNVTLAPVVPWEGLHVYVN